MSDFLQQFNELNSFYKNADIHIETLGNFVTWRNQHKIENKEWGRDKTIQLFQYLISFH